MLLACRGTISLARGDAEKAVSQFEQLTSIYPKSPQARYQLAASYLSAHDKVKAVASLNQALTPGSGYGQAAQLLAQLDIRGGDPAGAVELLTRYLKKQPGGGGGVFVVARGRVFGPTGA